jgi:formate dehydrogenase major subunit
MSAQAYINEKPYPMTDGESIFEFVSRNLGESTIPVLCQEKNLKPFGSCRMCSVEMAYKKDGGYKVVASCHTPVVKGAYIRTGSDKVIRLRKTILELVLSEYPKEKLLPAQGEFPTPFQKLVKDLNVLETRYPRLSSNNKSDHSHPYIKFDSAECINCYRCIRGCDEVQGQFVYTMQGRGFESTVAYSDKGEDFKSTDCVSCGYCVQTCPTNALSDTFRSKTLKPDETVRTICTYCGVGCNLEVKVVGGKIKAIEGAKDAEVNQGHTCVKGRYAFSFYNHPDRLTSPLIKKSGKFEKVSWDEALDFIAEKLKSIKNKFGPTAIAGISSARCTNEENYLMQKFMRVVIGSNNIDGCARVCHAPTSYGMQQVFGTGAATNSVEEIPLADCLLLVGSNPTAAHPVTGAKIKQRALKGIPLIVIDPRKTDLAELAEVHLQLRPGTNVALLNMFLHFLIKGGFTDQKFVETRTEGFDELDDFIQKIDIDELEKVTGVDRTLVEKAATVYGKAARAMCFHGLGVTEHFQGSKGVMLLADIAMLTGNIGRPGVGINPLRGQNNVQGAADMGVQPHQGPGYLSMFDSGPRELYKKHYGVDMPEDPGLKIPEMFGASLGGVLKSLWIMGEDVLQTDPNTCHVRAALEGLDLLVVQELFMTETAAIADVVLPASSFFEKSGTFTNGERRVQKVQRVVSPLPGTRPDGQIVVDIMNRLGYRQEGYDPALHLKEISKIVPFFAGITWENLGHQGKQWPVKADGTDTQILHQKEFKLGKGRFKFFDFTETPEIVKNAEKFPYILTTGRELSHYNCGSMTRRTKNIELSDKDVLLVNPDDAQKLKINEMDIVKVSSVNGSTKLSAHISHETKPGVLFTTFHFPEIAINHLTSGIFDEETMTPEFKVVAVDIQRV